MYYAIQQKSTGYFLPTIPRYGGSTFTVPQPANKAVPRLFTKKRSAVTALGWWLKGGHTQKAAKVGRAAGLSNLGDYEPPEYESVPQPNRDPDDFEVISMQLIRVMEGAM